MADNAIMYINYGTSLWFYTFKHFGNHVECVLHEVELMDKPE